MTSDEYEAVKVAAVRRTQDQTNAWLREKGFWYPGQTRPGLMHDLAKFRKESAPKPAGRDWARIMKSRIADGVTMPIVCEQFCNEALADLNRRPVEERMPEYAEE